MSLPQMTPVPGYEKFYAATEDGRVFSLNYRHTGKVVELAKSYLLDRRRGSDSMYVRVKAYRMCPGSPTPVHRIIALTFVPNPNGFPMVNHIDGNKSNNHFSNLEWVDNSANQKHASKTGLRVHHQGAAHPMAILTEDQVREIKAHLREDSRKGVGLALAKKYGVSKYCISDIKTGRAWGHIQ